MFTEENVTESNTFCVYEIMIVPNTINAVVDIIYISFIIKLYFFYRWTISVQNPLGYIVGFCVLNFVYGFSLVMFWTWSQFEKNTSWVYIIIIRCVLNKTWSELDVRGCHSLLFLRFCCKMSDDCCVVCCNAIFTSENLSEY